MNNRIKISNNKVMSYKNIGSKRFSFLKCIKIFSMLKTIYKSGQIKNIQLVKINNFK